MQYFKSLNISIISIISLLGLATLVSCGPFVERKETAPHIPTTRTTRSPLLSAPPAGSPEAKTLAQKLAQIEALDLLQKGEETEALKVLERSLALDPNNELAKKLIYQIGSDAQQEYTSTSFAYTVQVNDTMGKLAQRFLNDQYRFYILAKYNDMKVPNKLAVGQVIRIPGIVPKNLYSKKETESGGKTPETKKLIEQEKETTEIPSPPLPPVIPLKEESAKQEALIKQLSRDAESAYRKQQLDIAIQKWNHVLALAPDNQQAKQKRDHAQQLKDKYDKFIGTSTK